MKNKSTPKKATFALWEVIIITLIGSVVMAVSAGCIVYNHTKNTCTINTDSDYLAEFQKTYSSIVNSYYDNVDEKGLVEAAISGMLSYLGDPYTTYLNQNNTELLTDSLNGTYEGIGVEIIQNENNEIKITNVFESSPADKAGLQANDIILKVNDTDMKDKTSTDAVNEIKSSQNITILVKRNDQELSFELKKQALFVPAVSDEIFTSNSKNVGYIKITKFSDTSYEQFKNSLMKLETKDISALIIDVRNNTGGYLSDATNIAKLFLEKDKKIYSLESKLSKEHTVDDTEEHREYPVYVLVNSGSASASEVLAAALKYSYNSKLVGTLTYGKGKVQKTSTLSDGTMYKYTTAKWLTPAGDCIDQKGLTPDIEVELNEEYKQSPSTLTDNQLQTALSEITR